MRSHHLLVLIAAVFAGAFGFGFLVLGEKSGPTAGPDDIVLSVPGMHWGLSCEARVRAAVQSLPFVDSDSVRSSLASRRVVFRPKPGQAFDLTATRQALRDAGYAQVEVLSQPKG